jgi:hypothetical protein
MNWVFRNCWVAGFLVAANALSAERPAQPHITVWVYNYAGIDGEALARAKEEAGRILVQAGIEAAWVDCPRMASEVDRHPDCVGLPKFLGLVLRLRPGVAPKTLVGRSSVFGYALLPEGGGFGTYADVYAGGADLLANGSESLSGVMLGHLMAHELGHLLLGTPDHATAGIMGCPWGRPETEGAAQGRLLFNRGEAKRMRANLAARLRRQEADRSAGSGEVSVAREVLRVVPNSQ